MRVLLIACALLAAASGAQAQVCAKWGAAAPAGTLDATLINEASGLEVSGDRLYHHNDNGDSLRFFVTDLAGGATQVVNLKGPKPLDIEDMSLGPCGAATCIFLGDIGDNPASRSEVAFTLVTEKPAYAAEETPLRVVRARYPDGPHNAEGFAVHPNGDLYLITKPADRDARSPGKAGIYRLSAAQLRETEGAQAFAKVGELDLPKLAPDQPFYAWIPTAFDISTDGKRALVLTYGGVFELGFDLAQGVPTAPLAGKDVQFLRVARLQQQEAIAWLPDGSGFYYDSEAARDAATAPLNKVLCETR